MQIRKLSFLLLLLLGLFTACSDDDDDPSPSDLLAKTWSVSRVLIDGTEDVSTDYSSYRFTFNADGTFSFQNPDAQTGTWTLNQAGTQVTLSTGETLTVITLTSTSLVFEDTLPATFKDGQRTRRFELR